MKASFTVSVVSFLAATFACAEEPVDLDMVTEIRDEGFNRSEVMDSLRVLTDEIGPRLTASPGMREANKWTVVTLQSWGVENVYLESFDFGRGWSMERAVIHMTSPRQMQLHGLPVEWHPGTGGLLEGEVVHAPIRSIDDFDKWRDKLKGKMVLLDDMGPPRRPNDKVFSQLDETQLEERAQLKIPVGDRPPRGSWIEGFEFKLALHAFLAEEGAHVLIRKNGRAGMAISNLGYQYYVGETPGIPSVVLAEDHYKRLLRLAENGHKVRLSVDVDITYYDDDHKGYSTIAEIPGEGRNPEIVMAGAHLDSHATGDGASDNAAGVAVVMEAMRILKALGVEPKRTIRIGLWSGEEQEYYGSGQHMRNNFGHYPRKTEDIYKYAGDFEAADLTKPIVKERDYEKFSVYFNLDNGAGKIRGIHTEGNAAARPIFEAWFGPFKDLSTMRVSLNHSRSTDHESFQLIGLPGYQFLQDRSGADRGGHAQLDLYDEIYEKDLKQSSVILASFLYHAAMRDERMPRKAKPQYQ